DDALDPGHGRPGLGDRGRPGRSPDPGRRRPVPGQPEPRQAGGRTGGDPRQYGDAGGRPDRHQRGRGRAAGWTRGRGRPPPGGCPNRPKRTL
ncbi:MAG: hypothetical protein AVDCRST_MAG73-1774, partial [uncultured Thermomicrobiales bacterium]